MSETINKAGHNYDETRTRLERVEKQSRSIVHDGRGNQALIKADGENATVIDITEPAEDNEYVGPYDILEENYSARTFYPENRLWSFDGILSIPIKPIKTMQIKAGKKRATMSFSKDYQSDHNLGLRVEDASQSVSPKATLKQVGATFRAGMDVAVTRWFFMFSKKNVSELKFRVQRGWSATPLVRFVMGHFTLSSNIRLPAFRLGKTQPAFVQEYDGSYLLNKWVMGPIKKLFIKKTTVGISPVVSVTTATPFGLISPITPKTHALLGAPSMFRPDGFGMPSGFFYNGSMYVDQSKAEKIWSVGGGATSPLGLIEGHVCYTHRVYSFGESTWDGTNPFPLSVDVRALSADTFAYWAGFGPMANYADGSMVFRISNKALLGNGIANQVGQIIEQNQHLYKRTDRSVYLVSFVLGAYTHTGSKSDPRTFVINIHQKRFDDWLEVEAEQGIGATGGIGAQIGTVNVTMPQGTGSPTGPMLRATSSMDGKVCRLEVIAFDDIYEWISDYDGKDHRLVYTKKVIEFTFSDGDEISKVAYTNAEIPDVWEDFGVSNIPIGRPDFMESVTPTYVRSDEASSVTVHSLGTVSTDNDWYTVTASWKVTFNYDYSNSRPYGIVGALPGARKKLYAYSPTETGFISHNLTCTVPAISAQISYSHSLDGWDTFSAEGLFAVPHGSAPPVVTWTSDVYSLPAVGGTGGLGWAKTTTGSFREEVFNTSAAAISVPLGISAYDTLSCDLQISPWTITERYVDNSKVQDDLIGGESTMIISYNENPIRTIVRNGTGVVSDSNPNNDVFWDGTQSVSIYVPAGNPIGVFCTPWTAGFGARAQTGYLYNSSRILLESVSHGLFNDRINTTVRRIRNPRTGAIISESKLNLSQFL